MKNVSKLILNTILSICISCSYINLAKAQNPIHKLAYRILKDHADKFIFKKKNNSKADTFELYSKKDKIIIRGNNYNSMAVGLNHYLKNYCNTYVSWYVDDAITLPKKLPIVSKKVIRKARVKNRFFLNYCTFGYTMPWWKWKDWEHLIDWMALHGITMPLAITGQEAIWYDVWKEYGLSGKQIRNYFTGPAHLPWHRMSNLDKWGAPLPMSWLKNQKELQKKIVRREKELNMTPVLPAFSGHVPKEIKTIFPNAKISRLSSWGGFEDKYRSYFLDPLDSLFNKIQHSFLSKQNKIYGKNHIYGIDPFNEVQPPSWDPIYLKTISKSIYKSISNIDDKAVWLQMSWIFYFESKHWTNERIRAMLDAVPKNKMILLDYFCENQEVWKTTESFFGKPFIWNYLGNFGGNTMLVGNLNEVENRIENALENNQNMCGIGSTLEAFDVNLLMYEYVFDKVWSEGRTNADKWVQNWADIRYGSVSESNREAWSILHKAIYKSKTKLGQATLTNSRPTLEGHGNWTTNPAIAYPNSDLFEAWRLLLKNPSNTKTYKYDVANIGRQVLGNYFRILRDRFYERYKTRDLKSIKKVAKKMLDLFDDLDSLLMTQSSFLLGKWLNDAKSFGINEKEEKYYEHNARNIITTWGGKSQSLNDYANRSWAGLTKGFYKKRWEMFVSDVIAALENKQTFNDETFKDKVTFFEWGWTLGHEEYSSKPSGDVIDIASKLINKYQKGILSK